MDPDETHVSAHANWLDINGDGLTDFVSAKPVADEHGIWSGYWTVRLNSGGVLGPRIVTDSRRGIEKCTDATTSHLDADCDDRWNAPYESQFHAADTNNDGQSELLVPRGFAARICILHSYPYLGKPKRDYYCAEDPITLDRGPIPTDFDVGRDTIKPIYGADGAGRYRGSFDPSAYFMDSVHFVQTGPVSVEVRVANTPVIKGGFTAAMDLYGDGLQDQVSMLGYPFRPSPSGDSTLSGYAFIDTVTPRGDLSHCRMALRSPILIAVRKPFLSENLGSGARPGQGSLLPDFLSTVSNALGHQTVWNYSVLSSQAGRAAGELPLYSVPADAASRYIDNRHIYFTSSMPVVADMKQSDGLGAFRRWTYGYSEAMYNLLGRGFQGFRKISVEDESTGLRTTTAFYQKYPLTGQLEWVETSPRSTPTQLVSREDYIWRCNRSSRADTTACAVTPGSNPVRFPFLDTKESRQYDLTTGWEVGRSLEISAGSDCNVSFESTSGFDAYGNLTSKTVQQFDSVGNTDGYRPYVARQCERTVNTYVSTTRNWWLDKLSKTVRTTQVNYAAGHALPSGVSAPEQTLTTDYTWNTDRTLGSETVQSGVANQQRVSTYAYANPTNYGLPTSVTVVASGDDANGSRVTSTSYTADGYFPETVTNALLHVTSAVVRARDGQPTQVTDPNGLRTITTYDAFGFATRVKYRGALDSQFLAPDKQAALNWCSGDCGLARAVFKATVVQDGSPVQRSYQDALGRTLRSSSTLFDGTLSQSDTLYYSRGLVSAQSEPYRPGEAVSWTLFVDYDALGRPTSKSVPQQHSDNRGDRVTTYTYRGRRTDIQVCGSTGTGTCLSMSRTTDSLGRNVETVDALDGNTRYWFDANGNPAAIEDVSGNVVRSSYNALGQRISNQDPNQGASSFSYNALGEVLSQTDARGIVTTTTYDKLGRPKTSSASIDVTGDNVADSVLDTWEYDPANGKGLPGQSLRTVNGVPERRDTPSYDALARPFETATVQNTGSIQRNWTAAVQYDGYYGRPKAQTSPNSETVWLRYSSYGHLYLESDANGSQTYRQLTASDARGQPTGETYGNGMVATRSYWPASGQLKQIAYSNGRQLDYQYDVYGNLRRQELNGGASVEILNYDDLHRLKQTQRNGGAGTTLVNLRIRCGR